MGLIANIAYMKEIYLFQICLYVAASRTAMTTLLCTEYPAKKLKKCVLQELIEKKVLNEKSTYLCTSCANKCLETLSNAPVDKVWMTLLS